MPDAAKSSLRIYCVCGQKMKVSSSMYGLPGKCIACRQKIRLPRSDELEEGIEEIHLKDHPHLIRKSKQKRDLRKETEDAQKALDAATPSKSESSKPRINPNPSTSSNGETAPTDEPTPITELDIADASEVSNENVAGLLPLDELESLRRITSLQLILQRKLRDLRRESTSDTTLVAETELQLIRLKEFHDDLNEQMRQRLMEVAIELANTHDKISKTQISARVGEAPFEEFQDTIHRLRSRRDRLERRQINLRGWLTTTTPYTAGGLMDVTMDEIPEDGFRLSMPASSDNESILLNNHLNGLKRAFEDRAHAEKEATEIRRLREKADDSDQRSLRDAHETNRAERKIAKARVVFYQQRLEQLARDYAHDGDTLEACLEAARDRFASKSITSGEFDRIDKNARSTKADLKKGIALAKRLSLANAFEDVPEKKGTFLERLGSPQHRDRGQSSAVTFARVAAALWVFSVFLPVAGTMSLVSALADSSGAGLDVGLLLLAPIVAALVSLSLSFVPDPIVRGYGMLTTWAITALLIAFTINEAHFSLDLLASRFRSGGLWIARPGIIVLVAANLFTLLSGRQSLKSYGSPLRVFGAVCFATILGVGWFASNGLGTNVPNPSIELMQGAYVESDQRQTGVIRIENSGSRDLQLVSRRTNSRSGYMYFVEKKIGTQSYGEVTLTGEPLGLESTSPASMIGANGYRDFEYRLPPGDYRVVLMPEDTTAAIRQDFTIEDPKAEEIISPVSDLAAPVFTEPEESEMPAGDDPEVPEPEPVVVPVAQEVPAAELSGVIVGPDGQPRFSVVVTREAGNPESSVIMKMQEEVIDGWVITEYNRAQNAITVQKENTLLVLRRGDTVVLQKP